MKTLYLKDTLAPVDRMAYYVTPGKFYQGDLTPVMYHPNTFQPVEPSYIIKCDDGKLRKMDCKHFITLEDWRSQRLNLILEN